MWLEEKKSDTEEKREKRQSNLESIKFICCYEFLFHFVELLLLFKRIFFMKIYSWTIAYNTLINNIWIIYWHFLYHRLRWWRWQSKCTVKYKINCNVSNIYMYSKVIFNRKCVFTRFFVLVFFSFSNYDLIYSFVCE